MPPLQRLQTRAGRLSYAVSGSGPPTVLLFSGAGVTLDSWRALYPGIERIGRVLAWNRLGLEGSDAPRSAQTGVAVLAALQQLLGYAGLAPPYLLLGHSIGGLYANLFARVYPQQVAGVLFIEARHPADPPLRLRHEAHLARALSRVLRRAESGFLRNLNAERRAAATVASELEAAGPFPAVPLAVLTGRRAPPQWLVPPQELALRRANQQALAALSPRGTWHVAERSGHFPQLTEPHLVLALLRKLTATPARDCATAPVPAPSP